MQSQANNPSQYLKELPTERRQIINALREEIRANLPAGFEEVMCYGMLAYVVPHSVYPDGYHCDPKQPLPFISVASQKNHIALYHMGIYVMPELMDWFIKEYAKFSETKADIGKSCIRWKKPEQVPLKLIGKLAKKIKPNEWITVYEKNLKR